MDGSNVFRLLAVGALIIGAILVLLPTFLQQDSEARLGAQAGGVATPSVVRADLSVRLTVEGDAAAAVPAIRDRLARSKVLVDDVQQDGPQVKVILRPGTSRDQVLDALERRGERELVTLPVLAAVGAAAPATPPAGLEPALLARLAEAGVQVEAAAPVLSSLAGVPAPPGAAPFPVPMTFEEVEGKLRARPGSAWTTEVGAALLVLDGEVAGVVLPQGEVFPLGGPWSAPLLVALTSPALPPVRPVPVEAEAEPGSGSEPVEATASRSSLLSFLPDRTISMGLDIQGGIDLTLQVGLEEALLSQVAREAASLKEQVAKDGGPITQVRKDRAVPRIWVKTDKDLGAVQEYLRANLSGYVYSITEGEEHAFEMQEPRQAEIRAQAVEQVLEMLRKRIDETGVKEPTIVKKSGGRINVQLPGMANLQQAVEAIGTTALLEFRLKDHDFDDGLRDSMLVAAETALPADQFRDDRLLNEWLWQTKRLEEDRIILWQYEPDESGKMARVEPIVLKNEVVLTGNEVSNARVGWDQNNMPYVQLEFKPRGASVFCDITTNNVKKQFAIILDGQVRSAPSIRQPICGGAASIEMGSSMDALKDAQTLALVLRTGSLDAPVVVAQVRQVGASLGRDAVRSGAIAAAIGAGLVILYMLVWYRGAGAIASAALAVNVLLVLASLAMSEATLTLPGLAGIALTVGMAVDANIIIYERIREELRLGVLPRKAVDAGFEKALSAILDANITTAIAGIVLYSYGTGPVKGFAVTLLIGIATTLVSSLFVSRTLLGVATRNSAARLSI
jgi:preprotein translocase subunit SecD